MKKGFTLVELLAVIIIMIIILLLIVPTYGMITLKIKENMYNTKIQNVLSKGELYAEEKGIFIFDINELIEEGYLEPDNELKEYLDPRDNRDMRCDIINMVKKDSFYEGSVTKSDKCFSKEELENLYGIVRLKIVDENGIEIPKIEDTEWLKETKVYVAFEFQEKYQDYKDKVEEILWYGEKELSCKKEQLETCRYDVSTESVIQALVSLELKLNIDGIPLQTKNSINVFLDNVPPIIKNAKMIGSGASTSDEVKVEFELTDEIGSGVKEYAITKETTCNSLEYTEAYEGVQTAYLKNGEYYICSKDKVGNVTNDENLENRKIIVTNVDESTPTIESLTLKSSKEEYNTLTPNLFIKAYDDNDPTNTENLKICVSTTDYLKDCTWEKYVSTKSIDVKGSLDGGIRYVYVSITDEAGNVVHQRQEYKVYKYCDQKTPWKEVSNNASSCPKCGTANYTSTKKTYDKFFETIECPGTKTDTVACSIPSNCCEASALIYSAWSGWSTCSASCGSSGVQHRVRTATSKYNGQNCPISGANAKQEQACNRRDCCSSDALVYSAWSGWSTCTKTCGTGTQYRTRTAKSKYNGQSCTISGTNARQTQNCNTQSCIQYRSRQVQNASLTKTQKNPGTQKAYYCYCTPSGVVRDNTLHLSTPTTKNGYYGYYTGDPILPALPPGLGYFWKSGKTGKHCYPKEWEGALGFKMENKMTCTKIELQICSKGKYVNVAESYSYAHTVKCEVEEYSCPSGYTLSGTKCYGPWSAWSDTKVTPSSTLEVETRTP